MLSQLSIFLTSDFKVQQAINHLPRISRVRSLSLKSGIERCPCSRGELLNCRAGELSGSHAAHYLCSKMMELCLHSSKISVSLFQKDFLAFYCAASPVTNLSPVITAPVGGNDLRSWGSTPSHLLQA